MGTHISKTQRKLEGNNEPYVSIMKLRFLALSFSTRTDATKNNHINKSLYERNGLEKTKGVIGSIN